jgi:putative flavoprotein involved in K+ transport
MHSSEYRNPSQLQAGGVLIVGAANSGAEIALDIVRSHPTWLSETIPAISHSASRDSRRDSC